MNFLNVVTGKPFSGSLPSSVEVIVCEGNNVITDTVAQGDKDWPKALEYWMVTHGYAPESEFSMSENL